MGKKKATSGLGRALITERNVANRSLGKTGSWLHTSELNDGYNWDRLNLQSVTEQSSLDDFLATAELAGTEFVAEKLNIKFVSAEARTGLLSTEETKQIQKLHDENEQFLCIPRRPYWDESTSAEKLQQAERDSFLEWRRQLVQLEEEKHLILTPFERNLDFWRQLWRVIERSDVVVQIVDARNPLLFRCQDLERYVKEVGQDKENIILVNKADLLTEEQRRAWAKFFEAEGIKVVFWSALLESQRLGAETKEEVLEDGSEGESDSEGDDEMNFPSRDPGPNGTELPIEDEEDESDEFLDCEEEEDWQTCSEDDQAQSGTERFSGRSAAIVPKKLICNSSHLVQSKELLDIFKATHKGSKVKEGEITVGMVGYPNVGKSSTINTILGHKKVSVSATPGHTKHFQICQRIPRHVFESIYGINIVRPREDEVSDRPPTSEELLTAFGYMRGFMTAHGQPDQPRSARYILKDYVSGKLLFCHPPPAIDSSDFQSQLERFQSSKFAQESGDSAPDRKQKVKQIENGVDKAFFHQENIRALTKGVQAVMGYKPGSGPVSAASHEGTVGKPWKKHGNRNKKEKTRRLNKHLDA